LYKYLKLDELSRGPLGTGLLQYVVSLVRSSKLVHILINYVSKPIGYNNTRLKFYLSISKYYEKYFASKYEFKNINYIYCNSIK